MSPEAWAHSPRRPGQPAHGLRDHLEAVSVLSRQFADGFGSEWAGIAGRWHDLGKYRPGFQRYVRQDADAHVETLLPTGSEKTHSAAGALHALRSFGRLGRDAERLARVLAYVIAGHHAGLDDWHGGLNPRLLGSDASAAEREWREAHDACQRASPDLLVLPAGFDLASAFAAVPGVREWRHEPLAPSLWVRMLFSALVDADFCDTEAYYDSERARCRSTFAPLALYREQLDAHLAAMADRVRREGRADDAVMQCRGQVLAACRASAAAAPGVFTLAVPTGGGKTLASLAFALAHAGLHRLRRVVVAIPYTSIVEQTVDVFAAIFGRDAVVEHHSQAEADEARDTAATRLACENWDAPLVVTTNVQLLESLFAARTSRCRKLHNLSRSVIVLDEAHLLPPPLLQPALDALRVLVRHYGVTLVLCTATQPVLTDMPRLDPRQSLRGLPAPQPIVVDTTPLYAALSRVRFEWPADCGLAIELRVLGAQLAAQACVLAVVNTRRDAAELLAAVDAASGDGEPTLHLSAAMCGQHRADVIAQIRQRLAARRAGTDTRALRVVSTQLVEAGVDIDFPVVFRALAGLDSIAQAAGRCNREGLLGPRGGRVVVFVRPIPKPLVALRHGAHATVSTLAGDTPSELLPSHFERYFPLYHGAFDSRDEHGIVPLLAEGRAELSFAFREAAKRFRIVDEDDQASLVVPYVPTGATESPVLRTLAAIEDGDADRWWLRALQRFVVNVRQRDLLNWQARGDAHELLPGLYRLVDTLRYDSRLGLLLERTALPDATLVQ